MRRLAARVVRTVAVLLLLTTAGLFPVGGRSVADASGDSVRLVFFTDVQATTEFGAPEAMESAADAINAAEPDFVIAGGDLISGGFSASPEQAAEHWGIYASFRDRIKARVYPAIGNHDLVGAATAAAQDHAGPRSSYLENVELESTYYAFDRDGYHFIILDTVQIVGGELGYEGGLDDTQRDWLIADLSKLRRGTPIVVVSHMPLLTAFPAASQGWLQVPAANRVVLNANELLALFEGHRLELVLQGHLHVFETIESRGTTFVTGGAISGNWWKGARFGTANGFCIIELDGDDVEVRYQPYGRSAAGE